MSRRAITASIPLEYVNGVPHERVAQIHIAGHSKFEKYILDTHDHPVIDPVWSLYARAIELIGPTATLLEWDDRIPSFDEVHDEALKANRYVAGKVERVMDLDHIQHKYVRCHPPAVDGRTKVCASVRSTASRFVTIANEIIKPNDRLTSFERLEIYNRQYWFRILSALSEDFPGLRAVVGDRRFESWPSAYLLDCPSQSFTLRNLGSRLETWLRAHPEHTSRSSSRLRSTWFAWSGPKSKPSTKLPSPNSPKTTCLL
jgi:hypothetical protein